MKELNNPLALDSVTDLLSSILNIVIIIATPIVVFYLILAGFLYVTARGNAEKIQQANRAIMYGVIGGVIILSGVAITSIVGGTISQF